MEESKDPLIIIEKPKESQIFRPSKKSKKTKKGGKGKNSGSFFKNLQSATDYFGGVIFKYC